MQCHFTVHANLDVTTLHTTVAATTTVTSRVHLVVILGLLLIAVITTFAVIVASPLTVVLVSLVLFTAPLAAVILFSSANHVPRQRGPDFNPGRGRARRQLPQLGYLHLRTDLTVGPTFRR